MGISISLFIISIVLGVSIGLAQTERDNVRKRQEQIEKDLADLKEEIKLVSKYSDVEI